MTWTYVDPNTSDRDKIRFLIGDTDSSDPLLSDEEIAFTLSEAGGSVYQAGHDSCYAIAAKFSRMATSKSVGDLSISYSDRAAAFAAQAERLLELGARREPPSVWVSPDSLKRADDRVGGLNGTEFWTGQMDYLRSGDVFRPQP